MNYVVLEMFADEKLWYLEIGSHQKSWLKKGGMRE